MQGDSEGELLRQLGKATDSRDNTAGRDGEVACADGQPVGVVEDAECIDDGIKVGKRLALTHEHDARHALAKVAGDMEDLVDHLLSGERAREAREARCAERAAHGAAGLRRDAHRELVAVWHADRLDRDAVGKLEQVLAGAVLRNLLHQLLGNIEGEALGELLAQCSREVGHIVKRTYVLLVNPLVELLGAKCGLAKLLDEVREVIEVEKSNIARTVSAFHLSPFGWREAIASL